MKRAIIGLGVGAMILLCWTTSPQAFDRDITLPSPHASDPVIIYIDSGDDVGWVDPNQSPAPGGNDIEIDGYLYPWKKWPTFHSWCFRIWNVFYGRSKPLNELFENAESNKSPNQSGTINSQ